MFVQPIQVTVLPASLGSVYSIYILGKHVGFPDAEYALCFVDFSDLNQEKLISNRQRFVSQIFKKIYMYTNILFISGWLETIVQKPYKVCDVQKVHAPCRKLIDVGKDEEITVHIEWKPKRMLYNIKLYFVNMYICIYL